VIAILVPLRLTEEEAEEEEGKKRIPVYIERKNKQTNKHDKMVCDTAVYTNIIIRFNQFARMPNCGYDLPPSLMKVLLLLRL
jgi:hypothetical protein